MKFTLLNLAVKAFAKQSIQKDLESQKDEIVSNIQKDSYVDQKVVEEKIFEEKVAEEEIVNEKVADEEILEEVSDEKVSDEKVSDEKVEEKISDQKVADQKVADQKVADQKVEEKIFEEKVAPTKKLKKFKFSEGNELFETFKSITDTLKILENNNENKSKEKDADDIFGNLFQELLGGSDSFFQKNFSNLLKEEGGSQGKFEKLKKSLNDQKQEIGNKIAKASSL